ALQSEALDLARRFGFQAWMAQFLFQRFLVLIQLGDWTAAEADLAEVADLGGFRGYVLTLQGEMLALRGDLAGSRAAMNEVDAYMRTVDTAPQVTSVDIELSRSLLIHGDAAEALRRVRASPWGGTNDVLLASMGAFAAAVLGERASIEEMAAKAKAPLNLGLPRAVAQQLAAASSVAGGQWDEAHLAYHQAIAGFRALELHLDTALLGLEYAAYLGTRFEEARAAGAEAAAWFAERGAESVVERYRAAFKGTPAPPTTHSGVGTRAAVPMDAEQPA
ncbi:MAG: hypothetical protein ACRDE9_07200, partial [Candidatus Limnocylindria bacterium]